jgi:hypothetical protein
VVSVNVWLKPGTMNDAMWGVADVGASHPLRRTVRSLNAPDGRLAVSRPLQDISPDLVLSVGWIRREIPLRSADAPEDL